MSYSTLQTADTVPEGKVRLGAGAVMVEAGGFFPELGGRIGLTHNFDIGAKYSFPYLLVADAKYKFITGETVASLDLGWSYFMENNIRMQGLYPMIMVGRKNWYFGVKGNYLYADGSFDLFGSKITWDGSGYFGTTAVIGGVIGGDHIRLLLELNTYFVRTGQTFFVPGAGLYFDF